MKIGFATANLEIHGVATFTLNLSQWLQAAGHDVTVFTLQQGAWAARLTERGIKGEWLRQQPWEGMVDYVKRLATWVGAQRFDLLLVNVGSRLCCSHCHHVRPCPLAGVSPGRHPICSTTFHPVNHDDKVSTPLPTVGARRRTIALVAHASRGPLYQQRLSARTVPAPDDSVSKKQPLIKQHLVAPA